MLIALPMAAFCLAWLVLVSERAGESGTDVDWRGPFLKAAIVWGAAVAILSEGLGLFGLLRLPWLSLAWLAIVLALVVRARRRDSFSIARRLVRMGHSNRNGWEVAMLAGVFVLGLALLVVAWVSPPNNVDSLLYHMSRVMHWTQNGSLRHYATGYHHQLFMPPWAETAILNLRVLWGTDRPASLIQWASMVGSLVGVSAISSLLGVNRKGQMLATAFAASVPLGVLQATSTQNDYVVSFWGVCAAYLVTLSFSRRLTRLEIALLGLTLGLGVLTKPTFFVFGAPLIGGFLVRSIREHGVRRTLTTSTVLVALVSALNLPTWIRNINTYGGPYGSPDWSLSMSGLSEFMEAVSRLKDSLSAAPTASAANGLAEPFGATQDVVLWPVSRVAQAAALNLVTPSLLLNQSLWSVLDAFPGIFGGVVSNSLQQAAWSHEDSAGNPLHLLLVIVSTVFIARGARKLRPGTSTVGYAIMIALGYLVLPIVINPASSGFGIRFQLTFFVLWAPLLGSAMPPLRTSRWTTIAGIVLLGSALPYLLFNNTRPIIGLPPWPTRVHGVFNATPEEIMFAPNPEKRAAYELLAESVENSGCQEIGMRLDSSDLEYQFWWLLNAPQSGHRLETIYTYPNLEPLLDRNFEPCAVICTICGEQTQFGGLAMKSDFGGARLFLASDTSRSP